MRDLRQNAPLSPGDIKYGRISNPPLPALLTIIVFFIVLIVYLFTLSDHYSPDSMAFALLVTKDEGGQPLFFQAEHLFYPAIGWVWYRIWHLFGYNEGALRPLQVLNALFGAGGAALFFLTLRHLLGKTRNGTFISLTVALGLAFSYGYWYHSTGAEDQIIANAFVLASFFVLAIMWTREKSAPYLALVLGMTSGLAILFHATHVLFIPALIYGIWLVRSRWRDVLCWAIPLVLLVGISYLLIGSLAHDLHSLADYRHWVLSAPSKGIWGQLGLSNLWQGVKTLAGSAIYLEGGPNLRSLLGGTLEWRNLLDVALFVAIASGIIGSLAYSIRYRQQLAHPSLFTLSILWAVPYALFNIYWAPEDVQFWSTTLPPLALLLSLVLLHFSHRFEAFRSAVKVLCIFGVGALFALNLALATIPNADLSTNKGYAKAMCLRDHTEPIDLIITPGWDWAGSYVPYFAQREVLSVVDSYLLSAERDRAKLLQLVEERISQARAQGGKVYVARLYDLDGNDRAWLRRTTSLSHDDFPFVRRTAFSCLEEPIWEILPEFTEADK